MSERELKSPRWTGAYSGSIERITQKEMDRLESSNSTLMETAQAFCLKFLAYVKSNEGDRIPAYYHTEFTALRNLVLPEKEVEEKDA